MSVLWCGGEDIDFPTGGAVVVDTTASRFRSGYAKCSIHGANVYLQSKAFPAGAVTSCWLSFRAYFNTTPGVNSLAAGLVNTSTPSSGLWVGVSSSSTSKLGLFTYNGTTKTQLAAEAGNSINGSTVQRIDMQLVSYGATANVYVYIDGTLVISVTSTDVTIGGLTNLNAVGVQGLQGATTFIGMSEFIVADEDLRGFPGLVTLALTGDGTTTDWTGVYSTINGTTISDANPNYTDTNDLLQEFDVTNLPAGSFAIRAVKIAMRAAKATGTPTQIALGYNEGGTVTVEGDIALTTAYATYEQLDLVNPRTAAAWDQSIMNALQLTAKSRA